MLRPFALFVFCTLLFACPATQVQTLSFQPPPAVEADWPLFRGDPLQTGVAKGSLPDKLEVRWKVNLKKGIESTAAIVKDTVYIGCYDDHLYAFDLKTGAQAFLSPAGLGSLDGIAAEDNGDFLVCDKKAGKIYKVDGRMGNSTLLLQGFGGCSGVALLQSINELLVVRSDENAVSAYDYGGLGRAAAPQ